MFVKKRKILLMHSEIILNDNNFKSHFKHVVNCSSIIFKVEKGGQRRHWIDGSVDKALAVHASMRTGIWIPRTGQGRYGGNL